MENKIKTTIATVALTACVIPIALCGCSGGQAKQQDGGGDKGASQQQTAGSVATTKRVVYLNKKSEKPSAAANTNANTNSNPNVGNGGGGTLTTQPPISANQNNGGSESDDPSSSPTVIDPTPSNSNESSDPFVTPADGPTTLAFTDTDGQIHDYAGWYRAAIPMGYQADEGQALFRSTDDTSGAYISIDVMQYDPELSNIGAVAENQREYLAEDGESQVQMADEQHGAYMWKVVAATSESWNSLDYFADLGGGCYVQITASDVMMGDPNITSIAQTFSVLPGNPYENWENWYQNNSSDTIVDDYSESESDD